MLPGGTPLEAYLTMRQMKILEREAGAVFTGPRTVIMKTIVNERTVLEFAELQKRAMLERRPWDPNAAILETHSVQYTNNSIVQTGGRIVRAEVRGGNEVPAAAVPDKIETLSDYGLDLKDPALINFEIVLTVEPAPAAAGP
jgi:hypothetical protein